MVANNLKNDAHYFAGFCLGFEFGGEIPTSNDGSGSYWCSLQSSWGIPHRSKENIISSNAIN